MKLELVPVVYLWASYNVKSYNSDILVKQKIILKF